MQRVTEELAKVGVRVLTEIDVQATMKKKVGQDMPPSCNLGACNPQVASRVIDGDSVGEWRNCCRQVTRVLP